VVISFICLRLFVLLTIIVCEYCSHVYLMLYSSRPDAQNPLTMLPPRHTSSRHSRNAGRAWSSDIETLDPLHEPELRFSTDRNGPTTAVSSTHNTARSSQPYVPSPTACHRLQQTNDELFQL